MTYDGGIYVLDGKTLQVAKDIPLDGFNRLNPAGDDRHLLISTSSGFRVLDAAAPALTEMNFRAGKPGHVVRHAGKAVLFDDGTGDITVFDPTSLGARLPPTQKHKTPEAHHGVAVELATGELVTTLGNDDERPGIVVLDKEGTEVARNEDCPGVHGEATAEGEAVVIGCETGAACRAERDQRNRGLIGDRPGVPPDGGTPDQPGRVSRSSREPRTRPDRGC